MEQTGKSNNCNSSVIQPSTGLKNTTTGQQTVSNAVVAQEFEPIILNDNVTVERPATNGNVSEESNQNRSSIHEIGYDVPPCRAKSYGNSFYNHLRSERIRLETFSAFNWANNVVCPSDLARAGFYYLGQRDWVKCAFCEIWVGDWQDGNIPISEHMKFSPRCAFIVGYNVGNIPIGEDPIRAIVRAEAQQGLHPLLECSEAHNKPYTMKDTEDILCRGPVDTDFIVYECRIKSFENFPKDCPIRPPQLAEAGFYYTGG